MALSRILTNAANLLTGRNFSIERGQYGQKLVMHGAWDHRIARYMSQNAIRELELNDSKGFKHISEVPDFLNEVQELEALEITYAPFKNLEPLNPLGNLRSLHITHSKLAKGLQLRKLTRLEKLSFEWFKGAEGLFALGGLRKLSLSFYPQEESAPFSTLENIEEFRLASSGLTEVESFSKMTKMCRLELLNMNKLMSLRGLERLCNLRNLRIETCKKIRSVDSLADLTELRQLSISDCGDIASLLPLQGLKLLEVLHFFESTNILDGDLAFLRTLDLKDVRFRNRKHYNLRREEFTPFNKG